MKTARKNAWFAGRRRRRWRSFLTFKKWSTDLHRMNCLVRCNLASIWSAVASIFRKAYLQVYTSDMIALMSSSRKPKWNTMWKLASSAMIPCTIWHSNKFWLSVSVSKSYKRTLELKILRKLKDVLWKKVILRLQPSSKRITSHQLILLKLIYTSTIHSALCQSAMFSLLLNKFWHKSSVIGTSQRHLL